MTSKATTQPTMPTFTNIEANDISNLDFEVFCSCGAHMCTETDTRNSRLRGTPQAIVNACQKCISAATGPLTERIEELEYELAEATRHTQPETHK